MTGKDGGSVVASDIYAATLSFNGFVWTTKNASNLAGQTIDELLIDLPAGWDGVTGHQFLQATVDNLRLETIAGPTAIPEPASAVLFGTALTGLALRRRRRTA